MSFRDRNFFADKLSVTVITEGMKDVDKFPFIAVLAKAVTKLIPGEDTSNPFVVEQSSPIALGQAKEEILKMSYLTVKSLKVSRQYLLTKQDKHRESASQLVVAINILNGKSTDYLAGLSVKDLSKVEWMKYSTLITSKQDMEIIRTHIINIIGIVEYEMIHPLLVLEPLPLSGFKEIFDMVIDMLEQAIIAFDHYDLHLAKDVVKKGVSRKEMNTSQFLLLTEGKQRIVSVDLVSDLEGIMNRAVHIAETVMGSVSN
jgi:phosphate:Na+ symporter